MATTWTTVTDPISLAAHKARHQDGGLDEIAVTGLSGLLADEQHALATEIDYGLSFEGVVTTYTDSTHFMVSTLAGKGTGFFKPFAGTPYEIYVVEADGAAPEGEQTPVVAYTTADGTFQHAAFTGNLAVGDIVLIQHPVIASLGTKATDAATGTVTITDYLMAYIKQLVTELQVADALIDAIKAVTDLLPSGGALTALLASIASILEDTGTTLDTKLNTIAGYLDTEIASILAAVDTEVGDIKAKTDLIPADNVTQLDTNIPAIKAKTDLIPADITTQLDTNVPAIKAKTDLLPADTATQLDTNIPAIKAKTDTIVAGGATETNVDAVETKVDAVKTVVDAIPTTAMRGTDNALLAVNGALEATLTAIKGDGWTTETLKAIKDLVAAIPTTAMRGTDNALLAANYTAERGTDNAALAATALSTAQWTNALATALGSYTAALATALGNYNATRAGYLDELAAANIPTDTDPKVMGRTQIFEKSITSAANAGDVTVATITDQPCQIESVVIHADAAQTANMTSCGVFGGAGKVITFISATDAVQANLDAADKQVGWSGVVRLAATKTIVISLAGTGAAAVDLTIVVKYRASVSGGYLV